MSHRGILKIIYENKLVYTVLYLIVTTNEANPPESFTQFTYIEQSRL